MGKRSRKRGGGLPPEAVARPAGGQKGTGPGVTRRPGRDERPKAPWHPVPLVELAALAGIVLLIVGLLNYEEESGRAMIAGGLVLGSLAGLDTALREHFNGFRSHSTLIAGLPAVLVAGVLFFLKVLWPILIAAALATFVIAFVAARRAFRRRAGVSFR